MKKNQYFSILLLIFLSITLGACGNAEDSDLAKFNQAVLNLDSKNYAAIITSLGDCSQFSGEERQRCLLDLGAAYMASGGFSLLPLSQEILDLEQNKGTGEAGNTKFSNDFSALLITRVSNDSVRRGIGIINQLFTMANPDLGNRLCTRGSYDNYGRFVAQGCVSSNPLLLRELIGEKTTSSQIALSLEDLSNYANTIQSVAPEIGLPDIIDVVNRNDPSDSSKDKNNNNSLDSLDASSCVLNAHKSGAFVSSDCDINNTEISRLSTNAFSSSTNAALSNIFSFSTTISDSANSTHNVFYRLIQQSAFSTNLVTITTKDFCGIDGVTSCLESEANGTTCLPCPVLVEGGTRTKTFEDTLDSSLNNEDAFKAIASTLDIGDEDKTDAQKESGLRSTICAEDGVAEVTVDNSGKCTTDGKTINIPPSIAVDYFSNQ